MLSGRAHDYLSKLRFDAHAERCLCAIPIGGIYWSDEIPDFAALLGIPEDDRMSIYRLFSIRFRLWRKEPLSSEDERFWHYCKEAFPECPILRRTELSPDERQAQDRFEAEMIEGFRELCTDADDVQIKSNAHGIESFSVRFNVARTRASVPLWRRLLRGLKAWPKVKGKTHVSTL
jgi:hypothetical protein